MLGKLIESSLSGEKHRAFVPDALPLVCPIALEEIYPILDQSNQALGRLDGITSILPDTTLFIYMYVRKEALLSSQIEGTQSSLSDLLLYEINVAPGVPFDDVKEVSTYVAALDHGLKRLKEGFPLSLRLIKEMHKILLSTGRGSSKQPGRFRKSQNWLGGSKPSNAVFVPPPPDYLMECLDHFEKYLHEEDSTIPLLVRIAMIHYQFETIHPFLDGNGRLGRLLITLLLCDSKTLKEPVLYLSLYFKTHRKRYYELLQQVREEANWLPWIDFFLNGVHETAHQAFQTSQDIMALFHQDRKKIETLNRAAGSTLLLYQHLQQHPITSTSKASQELMLSEPTIRKSFHHLLNLGIVKEITGKKRDKIFLYTDYIQILQQGTEPL